MKREYFYKPIHCLIILYLFISISLCLPEDFKCQPDPQPNLGPKITTDDPIDGKYQLMQRIITVPKKGYERWLARSITSGKLYSIKV